MDYDRLIWHCGQCGEMNGIEDLVKKKCRSCDYKFHEDTWQLVTDAEITHHVTVLHRAANLVSGGRLAKPRKYELRVSTVHLELDHGFGDSLGGVFYETLIFDGYNGYNMWRYRSQTEADEGHIKVSTDIRDGRYEVWYRVRDGRLVPELRFVEKSNRFHGGMIDVPIKEYGKGERNRPDTSDLHAEGIHNLDRVRAVRGKGT